MVKYTYDLGGKYETNVPAMLTTTTFAGKYGGIRKKEKKRSSLPDPVTGDFASPYEYYAERLRRRYAGIPMSWVDPVPKQLVEEYWTDPFAQQLMGQASYLSSQDYTQQFRQAARSGAEQSMTELSAALASRGGGGLGDIAGVGAQVRGGAEMGALTAGAQAQMSAQDVLLNALTHRYNVLNSILGAQQGFAASQMQYQAAREQSEAMLEGSKWQAIGTALSGIFSRMSSSGGGSK